MITGTTVTAKTQDGDTNNYEVSFDLGLKAINKMTDQELSWYLVRTQGNVESLDMTCTLQSEKDDTNNTKYFYDGCSAKTVLTSLGDGVLVGFGKIANQENATALVTKTAQDMTNDENLSGLFQGEKSENIGLTGQKLYTNGNKNSEGKSNEYTYYLIVEFPNDESQSQNGAGNANFGKQISVTFDEITNIQSSVIAE